MKVIRSKEQAIERLNRQLVVAEEVKRQPRFSPDFKKWQRDTRVAVDYAFLGDAQHLKDFDDLRYSPSAWTSDTPDSYFEKRFREGVDQAAAVIKSYLDEVEIYWSDSDQPNDDNILEKVESICGHFHAVVRQLRERRTGRLALEIEDEYDVQYLIHALLRLEFDDIRAEEWTPSYAGSCSRMDFLLKREQVVIEVKKTRPSFDAKELGDQLIVDIGRYRSHPDCRTLVCFVYDPEGRLANPIGIENDLGGDKDGLRVKVMITPR